MSGYIWNIDIKGNSTYTEDTLKNYLSSKKVKEGMKKKKVNCQEIVRELRENYEKVIWASVSVKGCRLKIQIKENEDGIVEHKKTEKKNTNIIAGMDCKIVKCITRAGTPMIHEGASVQKGDLLVSGLIPICNDAKEVVGYEECDSDADIIGEINATYYQALPKKYFVKKFYLSENQPVCKRTYEIRVGDYFFQFGQSKNSYAHCEQKRIQREIRIANVFPIVIERTEVFPYRQESVKHTRKDARQILSADFAEYCKEMKKKGVEIIQNDVKIYTGSGTYYAKGTLKMRCSVVKKVPGNMVPVSDTKQEQEMKNGD